MIAFAFFIFQIYASRAEGTWADERMCRADRGRTPASLGSPGALGVRRLQAAIDAALGPLEPDACVGVTDSLADEADQCQAPSLYSGRRQVRTCTDRPVPTAKDCDRYKYNALIAKTSNELGIDPVLLQSKMWIESGFDESVRSPRGAFGIMQFMPTTARQYAKVLNRVFPPSPNDKTKKVWVPGNNSCTSRNRDPLNFCHPLNQVRATALMLIDTLDLSITVGPKEKSREVPLATLFYHDHLELTRFLMAGYNMGVNGLCRRLERFVNSNGLKVPADIGEFFSYCLKNVGMPFETRCYVYRLAGLCGDQEQGYLEDFASDWGRDANGQWVPVIPDVCQKQVVGVPQ